MPDSSNRLEISGEPLLELTVESLVPGGDGLARHEGKVIFIPGVLPGERVQARLLQSKRDFARAEAVSLLAASPDRVAPGCAAADRCGGCDWLHIAPEAQARLKVAMARDAYRRLGGFDYEALTIESGDPWGYRNRLQVHADRQGRLGFMGRQSRHVAVVNACPVAHEALQPLFRNHAANHRVTRFQAFGHATRGRLESAREDETPDGIMNVRLLGRDFVFPLAGFFQSNIAMLEKLIPWALQGLPMASGSCAMDLYSGVGLFASFLADHFETVVAVEEQVLAAEFIKQNAGPKVEVHTGKLEEWGRRDLLSPVSRKPDLILVDPPREGLHAEARHFLLETAAEKMIYVSCDVVTQARDLKVLLAGGYRLEALQLFDFYPQTHHVEAVAKLVRA